MKIKHKSHFVYFQIIIGKIKKQMCATTRTKFEPKEGELCLTDIEKYIHEWPQLAEILKVDKENAQAEVHWYKGCKSGPWKPCTIRSQCDKVPRFVPFTEIVPLSCIWLSGFQLTPTNVLPSKVKKAIENHRQESPSTSTCADE